MAKRRSGKRGGRTWAAIAGVAALCLLVAAGAWAWRQYAPVGRIGSVYLAKQYCSCLFVTGRSEASCRAEFKPYSDQFSLKVDRTGLPAHARVDASVAAIFKGAATYEPAYGCTVAR